MGKRVLILVLILCLIPSISISKQKPKGFDARVNIHGGTTKTKSMALWEIQRYRDTVLIAKSPLCYAPWRAYLAVDKYVEVTNVDNCNALVIKTDLAKEVAPDAAFNRNFAKRFKGKSIKTIYRYCARTKYVIHVKTARDVFTRREADCAGITAAFYVICKVNRIPVRYVTGWDDFNGCHAWNKVKVKGKWYYVDCTKGYYLSRELWTGYSIMEEW